MKPIARWLRLVILMAAVFLLFFATGWGRFTEKQEAIVINEVCAHNSSVLEQPLYGSCDYIELYNAGSESVNLKGYGLSDKRNGAAEFVFEDCELGAGSRIVVFASGAVPDLEEHIFANFRISDDETVYLTDPGGKIIDYVDLVPTTADIVYARESDGAEKWTTMKGSPWARNDSVRKVLVPTEKVAPPVLSADSGFYEDGFALSMEAEEGCLIYYTLDGSEPYLDDAVYEEALQIGDASVQDNVYCSRTDLSQHAYEIPSEKVDKATVVRAVAVDEHGRASSGVTAVYFVGERFEKYRNWNVVSLVADPDDLFGYENGIYVLGEKNDEYHRKLEEGGEELDVEPANYMLSGRETRRDAVVTVFDRARECRTKQEVGIHISGNYSRSEVKKSFRVAANTKYGNEYIDYDSFLKACYPKSLVLRNAYGKNQWIQELAKECHVGIQESEPCVLFLDGEYWGTYCIQERCSAEYVENFSGILAEQVILIKGEELTTDPLDEHYAEYQEEWEQLCARITEWNASGRDCYEEIAETIDIQSYVDYICIQTYLDNWDFSNKHNVALWKAAQKSENVYGDGKWRWIFYDLDYTMVDPARNTFTEPGTTDYTVAGDPLFVTLMRSDRFRREFVNRFCELADHTFSYERVAEYMENVKDVYGLEEADACVEFIQQRPQYAFLYLKELFGLSDEWLKEREEKE